MNNQPQDVLFPILIRFSKTGLMRFIGHLDWLALQEVIFLRAGLSISQSLGPTKRLKIKCSPPTPVGVASKCEYTYLQLTGRIYPDELARRLNAQCPDGIDVLYCLDAGQLKVKNPFAALEAVEYSLETGVDTPENEIGRIFDLLAEIKNSPPPEDIEPESVKQFWGRIIELNRAESPIKILAHQSEGKAFHAAKCAGFLQERLELRNYPIFTREEYFRLTPQSRKLFTK